MAVQGDRYRQLACAAGQVQHRAPLLSRQVDIEGQVRADRQEHVVEIRVIVEVGSQKSEVRSQDGYGVDALAILTQIRK